MSSVSEAAFAKIFASAPAAMIVTRLRDGLILDANDECGRLLGYARAAMVGRTSVELGVWSRTQDREAISALLDQHGMVRDLQVRLRTASGDVRSVRMDAQAMNFEDQRIVLSTFIDATETERRLRESDDRFRAAFMTSSDACVMIRQEDGRILEMNDRFVEMYGYTREESLGKTSLELGVWANPEQRLQVVAEMERSGRVRDMEILAARKNGEIFHVLYSVTPLEVAGQPSLYVGAIRDVTEQYRSRAELKRSEALLRRSHRLASLGTYTIDLERQAIQISAEMSDLLGLGGLPAVMPLNEYRNRFYYPEDLAASVSNAEDAYRDGRELTLEARAIRTDGKMRWVRTNSAIERDRSNAPFVLGVMQDITEERELESRLRQAQKMEAIGVLAGGVAHDFNNILAAILSYTVLLLQDLRSGDPMRDDVLEIQTAAERAADLTRQLLAFSRQQILQPRVVDLNDVVTGMTKMLRRLIGEDIQLIASPWKTQAPVFVDPGQLEQVLMNLTVNARDAMPTGGTLNVDVSQCDLDGPAALRLAVKDGPYVRLDVTDTGCGIDKATQARIFEPFFTTKEIGKGTGLGLSTVFGIVSQSGGALDVESEPHRGTRFRIWLPLAAKEIIQPVSQQTSTSILESEQQARGTILLVEDDEHVRRLALAVLAKKGYSVLSASSGGDALILWEKHAGQIDLVLTDVVMPLISGDELIQRLLQLQPGLRFAYMSGYPDKVAKPTMLRTAVGFLEKPFTPDKLLRCVAEALARGSG